MGTLSFVIDPDAAIPLTGDQIVTKINDDTVLVIDRADSVDPAARPIEADEVTATEIATDAVGSDEIASGAVDSDELAGGAVTEAKIGALAISEAKIQDDAITGNRIRATGTLTLTDQPLDTETVTIGSKTYTFQTVLTDVDGNVLIGATASDSLDNLVAAVNLDVGAGTLYATSMTEQTDVDAAAGAGDTVDLVAQTGGTAGNSIATTETLTDGSFGDVTLTGGANAKMKEHAGRDSLDSDNRKERKYVRSTPASGQYRVVGTHRKANGDLEVEYDSVPVA